MSHQHSDVFLKNGELSFAQQLSLRKDHSWSYGTTGNLSGIGAPLTLGGLSTADLNPVT